MKKEKILINIENLNELNKYKKIGINNFLFAVDLFSIGYNSFSIETLLNLNINNIYILINRILDCNLTDKLKEVKYLFTKFKGILFEDIAVYNIFKDTNLELIMNSSHFLTNINTINYCCNLVKSTTISNELTKEEVPHNITCITTKFEEKTNIINIYIDIIVSRDSLKKIIIGHNGNMLKEIGSRARVDLENKFGKQIYLDLYVKTIENWRDKEKYLKDLGFINE